MINRILTGIASVCCCVNTVESLTEGHEDLRSLADALGSKMSKNGITVVVGRDGWRLRLEENA